MKEIKNKVGRPKKASRELKIKAIKYIFLSLIIMSLILGLNTFIFKSNINKLKAQSSNYSASVVLGKIYDSYFNFSWTPNKVDDKYTASNYTIYYSDSKGRIKNEVFGKKTVNIKSGETFEKVSGLKADTYYYVSVKFKGYCNNKKNCVVNKHFKTKPKGYYYATVNIGKATDSTVNFDWYVNDIKGNIKKKYAIKYEVYNNSNISKSSFKYVEKLSKKQEYVTIKNLKPYTKYYLYVYFDGNCNDKENCVVKKTFTTKAPPNSYVFLINKGYTIDSKYIGSTLNLSGDTKNKILRQLTQEWDNDDVGTKIGAQALRDCLMSNKSTKFSDLKDKCGYELYSSSTNISDAARKAYNYVFEEGKSALKHRIISECNPQISCSAWHSSLNLVYTHTYYSYGKQWTTNFYDWQNDKLKALY